MSGIEDTIEAERARIASRISELKAQQTKRSDELEREQRRAASAAAEENNDSFFSRIVGRKKSPARAPEVRIREPNSKLAPLPDEVVEQQRQLKMIDLRSSESRFAGEWTRLESMQARLKELEQERLDRIQLVKERAELTGSIADAVSRIPQGKQEPA
jgi:hypothetical protein